MTSTFYRHRVYPALVNLLGDPPPFREVRRRILPSARGTVLEIGVGPGPNFAHYDRGQVDKLYALEPNPGMVRLAERERRRNGLTVEFLDLPAERIPLADATADTVVSTFTMCTIPDVAAAIRDLRRVLRPDGTLIFFEHGRAPDERVRRWQRWSEPIPKWIFEGCHVTRDIPSLIRAAGFTIEQMSAAYLAGFPKAWTHCWWGTARPA
jgi:ubiquinone/menaquinone biosynthesis C-methylase UbiE